MQLDAIGWLNILQNVENDITLGDFVREQPFSGRNCKSNDLFGHYLKLLTIF
jgi:hypothetical protein